MMMAACLAPVRAGGQAGGFLRQDVNARGAALAGALTSDTDDAASVYLNPAGLSRLAKPEVGASHAVLFEDTANDFVAAAAPIRNWGTFAAGYLRQYSGGFERRATPNDTPVSFSIVHSAFLGGWGRSWSLPDALRPAWVTSDRPLETGLSVDLVRESIDQVSASGSGLNAGLTFRPRTSLALSVAAQNLMAP
ncbi:MAG: hypothetical protein PHF00_11435, partial [Elusimicrobia bacterium]|nr:hypothetical protein [Elusimicrobiota bacterium]